MAYHRKHHRKRRNDPDPYRRRRHNPLGVSTAIVKDAAWVAGGAVAAAAIPGMFAPTLAHGWTGVLAKGVTSVAASFVARMIGGAEAGSEALKGGLAITVLSALNQAGIKTPGLGLYAPSWFGVPTASDQYLRAYQANLGPGNRGRGTIFFPGPGGPLAAPAPAAAVSGLGYHRFRSRYQGGYGG